MKITQVKLGRISTPLRVPFKTALRTVSSVEDVIVELHTDTGAVGYGEAPPTGVITGDTTGAIIGAIRDHIAPAILGRGLDEFEDLTAADHETAHGGYDPVYANADPNRVLPVDVLRDMEREGKIGKLHEMFYTTVGNGTSVANAKKFAAEYAQKLLKAGVHAVIMTST